MSSPSTPHLQQLQQQQQQYLQQQLQYQQQQANKPRAKNAPPIKQIPKKQRVPARVVVYSTKPGTCATVVDKVWLEITFLANTRENFLDRVAVHAGDEVKLTAGLPSLFQADEEMMLEFFENLMAGLAVTHDSNAGVTTGAISIDGL